MDAIPVVAMRIDAICVVNSEEEDDAITPASVWFGCAGVGALVIDWEDTYVGDSIGVLEEEYVGVCVGALEEEYVGVCVGALVVDWEYTYVGVWDEDCVGGCVGI